MSKCTGLGMVTRKSDKDRTEQLGWAGCGS